MRQHNGSENTLAIDRFPLAATDALRQKGLRLTDADAVMFKARHIKMAIEIAYVQEAMMRVEKAVADFESNINPGMTEAEVWAGFHQGFIRREGQYLTTRLLQSGERTFPYFQECGNRRLRRGDLVCLDTDALGYRGYAVDFSRTFLCGDEKPTSVQRHLYGLAKQQLDHNVDIIQPYRSFEEIAEAAWPVPEQHQDSRYYCIAHGLGMSGEYPNIPHKVKGRPYPLNGEVKPGMILCVESYIGAKTQGQGVKLEQQLLTTESGTICLSQYPFDDHFS